MRLTHITKRNGGIVPYNRLNIQKAIEGANKDTDVSERIPEEIIPVITESVENRIQDQQNISVEQIQDEVEKELMGRNFFGVAKNYITYREKHASRRKAGKELVSTYKDMLFEDASAIDLKRDNANINTDAPMGIMLKIGTESCKYFIDNYVLPEEIAEADKSNHIHIHDKDFSLITLNCCQIDLLKLFKGGFSTGHGYLREPQSIRAYSSLACIAIQSNQNDMFGGQSINCFDYAMAEGVRKSFKKILFQKIRESVYYTFNVHGLLFKVKESKMQALEYPSYCGHLSVDEEHDSSPGSKAQNIFEKIYAIQDYLFDCAEIDGGLAKTGKTGKYYIALRKDVPSPFTVYELACEELENETFQAMEAFVHNMNTLHSRAGAQVPFSSINYGMDTSPEGRLVTRSLLKATWNGLGNGETPIFPVQVFQVKSGVNYEKDDPNYDLFQYACKVSARRLFPNFCNLNAPYNAKYYKPGDYNSYVATMGFKQPFPSNHLINGCRTI